MVFLNTWENLLYINYWTSFIKIKLDCDVNQAVTVYVGYDSRITIIPSWLLGFTGIGDEIVTSDTTFRLFARNFPAGSVVLGGNDSVDGSMYTVIVNIN